MTAPGTRTYGDIENTSLPLAVLVHGFPDTPYTWRHLGPELVQHGYRVVAPLLPGHGAPVGKPISVGTYARAILQARRNHQADDRAVLIGHDWGAIAGYGAVASDPAAFARFVALAVPPTAALASGIFSYAQLKRSFYIWFIQQVGIAEATVIGPGFFESLWADWSPGYDPTDDIAELRQQVNADNIADVIAPYRASFNPAFADPAAEAEAGRDDAATAGADAVSARCHRRRTRRRPSGRRRSAPTRRRLRLRNHRRRRPFPASGTTRADRGQDHRLALRLARRGAVRAPSRRPEARRVAQFGEELIGTAARDHVVAHGDTHHRGGGDIAVLAGDDAGDALVHDR